MQKNILVLLLLLNGILTGQFSWQKVFTLPSNTVNDLRMGTTGTQIFLASTILDSNTFQPYIIKLDHHGLPEEAKKIKGSSFYNNIIVMPDSGLLAFGSSKIVRFDNSLNILWSKEYSFSYRWKAAVACKDGGVAILGDFTSFSNDDFSITKIDSSGNVVFNKLYSAPEAEYCADLTETPNGDIAVVFTSFSFNVSDRAISFMRIDQNGNIINTKSYLSYDPWLIRTQAESIINFQDGFLITGELTLMTPQKSRLILIYCDSAGNRVWSRTYAGSDLTLVPPQNIAVRNNKIFLSATKVFPNYRNEPFYLELEETGAILRSETIHKDTLQSVYLENMSMDSFGSLVFVTGNNSSKKYVTKFFGDGDLRCNENSFIYEDTFQINTFPASLQITDISLSDGPASISTENFTIADSITCSCSNETQTQITTCYESWYQLKSGFEGTHYWSTGSTSDNIWLTDTDNTSYYCETTMGCGMAKENFEVLILECAYIDVPNVFTPNNDGINEEFQIKCYAVQEMSCNVYDRWGRKVGEITQPDGTWSGENCSVGTYFYSVKYKSTTGEIFSASGHVSLLR